MVKDLFKWIEVPCRSVITLVGYEWVIIFALGGLQKSTYYVVKFHAQKLWLRTFKKKHFR